MILLSIAALLLGAGFGFLISKRTFQNKLRQQLEESLGALKAESEAKDKELMTLRQSLADTSYKYSELEKDCRSLQQQLDRSKA